MPNVCLSMPTTAQICLVQPARSHSRVHHAWHSGPCDGNGASGLQPPSIIVLPTHRFSPSLRAVSSEALCPQMHLDA